MNAKDAIKSLGGITKVSRRYGIPIGTVGIWSARGRISANAFLMYPKFARAIKKSGYTWTLAKPPSRQPAESAA